MKLPDTLKAVGDTSKPLEKVRLRVFSDLDASQAEALQSTWTSISTQRRIEIVKAFLDLAEDNVDLNFHQMFFLCLDDEEEEVRATAVEGLWEDERLQTLRRLLQLVDDPSPNVRARTLITLSRFAYLAEVGELPEEHSELLYTTLTRVMRDSSQPLDVRRRAMESAGYFSQSSDVQAEVARAYEDSEQLMRESALVAMGRSMNPRWFSSIEQSLQSISPALRYEAARAMGELAEDGRSMVSSLLPLTEDRDVEVSQAAIWALGQIGGSSAKRTLQRLSQSNDPAQAMAADEALNTLMMISEDEDLIM